MTDHGISSLRIEPYLAQQDRWPASGRFIMAQCDADSIVVYQAYRPEIGQFAARQGYFGGAFSFSRMSWIKTSFLWMMFRSDWGMKPGQEVILAIRLKRSAFLEILLHAVHSSFESTIYGSEQNWKEQGRNTDVRLQWDPDHDPDGTPVERKAIQLGLRGNILQRYASDWLISITDISDFVADQRANRSLGRWHLLQTPSEGIMPLANPALSARLGLTIQ
jgi:hypothetical protein